jgi:hypothetical protein
MFTRIATLLTRHRKPAIRPSKAVDDFRTAKRAEGYAEQEISDMLVASRIQSEANLISQGYSDRSLDRENWGYLLYSPLPSRPTRSWVEYPNDWRELQGSLRARGCPSDLIDDVLQDIAAKRRHEAQPPSLLPLGAREELPGALAKSIARLFEQGFREAEIAPIIGARMDISSKLGVSRYPDCMEAPMRLLIARQRPEPRQSARPALRLVANNRAPRPR